MADRTWTGRLLLKGEDRGISKSAQKVETAIGGVTRQLRQFGALAAIAGGAALFAGSVGKIREFEKSISDLSAITGAAGRDLDFLTEASKRIGQTTTLTASQAAEAFKLIASAKPDLLSNVEALNATTEAAVTLSEAAGIDLPTAASALGESLNQFGASADEAARFINVLAAGAKFGSSEIAQTSEALVNAGTVAKLAGLSFETTNAAIQAMAAAGVKGKDAGTKLRSVLIALQVQANDNFNPAVVGMVTAIDNLGEANLSVTEKMAIFGKRGISTADILVSQRRVLRRVEEQVTATTEAYDQAAKRVDNLDGDIKRLSSAFEAFQLGLANDSLPVLRVVVKTFTDIFNALALLNSSEGINRATSEFSLFEASMKAVFITGNIVFNILESIFDSIVAVGQAIALALQGEFGLIDDRFVQLNKDINNNFNDIGDAIGAVIDPAVAAEVKANADNFFKAPLVQSATEAVAEVKKIALTAGQEASIADEAAAAKKLADDAARREELLENFRQGLRTELEVLEENRELRLAEISLLHSENIFLDEEAAQKRLDIEARFQEDRSKLVMKDATNLQKFEALTAKNKTKFVIAEAVKLTQGVAQNSKTLFKINKVAAIANAVVNTGQAITKTMAAYPFPVNIALAALTAAAGFAQIQAIRSTQFSGGGTGTTPSAAGSVPVLNDQALGGANEVPIDALLAGQGGAGGVGQRIDINIDGLTEGGLLPADATRVLIESINEQLGDGVNLNVTGENGTGD